MVGRIKIQENPSPVKIIHTGNGEFIDNDR